MSFLLNNHQIFQGPSWSWSYSSWIYNYLCNRCLSQLTLRVRIPLRRGVLNTTLCDKVCQWLVTGRWFPPSTAVSSTNKTDCHYTTEISLKVALNTITLTFKSFAWSAINSFMAMWNKRMNCETTHDWNRGEMIYFFQFLYLLPIVSKLSLTILFIFYSNFLYRIGTNMHNVNTTFNKISVIWRYIEIWRGG